MSELCISDRREDEARVGGLVRVLEVMVWELPCGRKLEGVATSAQIASSHMRSVPVHPRKAGTGDEGPGYALRSHISFRQGPGGSRG